MRISLVVVYMPHCGYIDDDVQEIYDILEQLHEEARKRKRIFVVGGDWNAEVQSVRYDTVVGGYANQMGNSRGEWLRRWATSEKLMLTNTFFKKRWGLLWTHSQNGRKRQIDYIAIDSKYRSLVKDAQVDSRK